MHEKLSEYLIVALRNKVTPADALRAYNNIRSAMLDQLGMEPGTALQKLQRIVLCREGIRGRALGNRNPPAS